MTKRLAIKQNQIEAGIRAAEKLGHLCEINFENGSMRFIHKNPQDNTLDDSSEKPNSLAEWQGKANGQS
jgi:hypothetical protein